MVKIRDSQADTAALIRDEQELAKAEARNGLRQMDAGISIAIDAIEKQRAFQLRVSTILTLHREALQGISEYAGNFRPAGVKISGSTHEPPAAHLVAELVEDMCDYVNENWAKATPVHLAAYVMWRLN